MDIGGRTFQVDGTANIKAPWMPGVFQEQRGDQCGQSKVSESVVRNGRQCGSCRVLWASQGLWQSPGVTWRSTRGLLG